MDDPFYKPRWWEQILDVVAVLIVVVAFVLFIGIMTGLIRPAQEGQLIETNTNISGR